MELKEPLRATFNSLPDSYTERFFFNNSFILLFSLLLVSCIDWDHTDGVVLDYDTHQPISHVGVAKYQPLTYVDINKTFSDSSGKFHYVTMHRDRNFIYFSKERYLTTTIEYNKDKKTDTIFLAKEKK